MMTLYNAGDHAGQFLKIILDVKGLPYLECSGTVLGSPESGISIIEDGELLLTDVFTAAKYIDERHPSPKLFSKIPEQNARLNMLITKLIKEYYDTNNDITTLKEQLDTIPLNSYFVTGDKLSIIDLAIYPLMSETSNFRLRIDNYINKKLQK